MVKIKLTVLLSLLCFNYDLVRCETTENFVNFCVTNGSKVQFDVENTLEKMSCTCNQCIKRYFQSGLIRFFKINSSEYGGFIRIAKSIFNNSSLPVSGINMPTMESFNYCSINMTYLCFKMIDPNLKAKFNGSRYSVNPSELFYSSGRFCNDPADGTYLCYTPKRPYSISMVNSTGNVINFTLFCFTSFFPRSITHFQYHIFLIELLLLSLL